MTGFGRGVSSFDSRRYTVDIKTVNHRYNDISIRMPRFLIALEDPLRQIISKYISRGRIDVFINVENLDENSKNVKVDSALAGAYIEEMRKLISKYDLTNDISATSVLRLPDVITSSDEVDEDLYLSELTQTLNTAIENLNSAREKEGSKLREDITNRLNVISSDVDAMSERSANLLDEYKLKLENRIKELNIKDIIDETRLGAEIVLFADKSSICEEITRLRAHIESFIKLLNSTEKGACGKKLDFILQEMNREVNTIGSKANCIDITNSVVNAKNEIENIREQVQNIE
jgi:uncharacterized protein (TIGR00255 family)